jgi:hypothetical protein
MTDDLVKRLREYPLRECREAADRIEKLEAANLKQSCIKVDDQMRIEKLEAALEDMAQYISRADWMQLKKETHEVWDLGGIND